MVNKVDHNLEKAIWEALEAVKDPEIPVISIVDMGLLNDVSISDQGEVTIAMTPTFTGCPAIDYMKADIIEKVGQLEEVKSVTVNIDFSNSWNTNRITKRGREQLKAFGLAPPPLHQGEIHMEMLENVACPYCDGQNTSLNTPFGPTLCRSIHYCHDCKEAFQQFKPV